LLSVRLPKRLGVDPVRIIIDSTARIPLTSRILSSAQNRFTIVAVTNRAPANRIKKIQQCGAMVIVAGSRVVDLKNLLSTVRNIGIHTVLVEGGGELNWSLVRQGLASELIVTIAPLVAGGRTATTLVEGEGYRQIRKAAKMNLTNLTSQRNGEVVLYYRLRPSAHKSSILR
jgi:2,5-diamino-6-(ribosylamino)-4(3H)-pyrimidinone 5'-phosphate reductase